MISGVVLPKSGHIYVKSKSGDKVMDITDPFALSMFRQELGVCPQFDVIFESLTVREHLELYCGIKGVTIDGRVGDFISSGQKEAANLKMQYVEAIARDVELYAKLDAYISTLSGGMRRKLSVAIALLGSPRIVLLDEPTTGMDVAAQQRIWSLIRSCKKNRVLIDYTFYGGGRCSCLTKLQCPINYPLGQIQQFSKLCSNFFLLPHSFLSLNTPRVSVEATINSGLPGLNVKDFDYRARSIEIENRERD
ncbi:ABC transporter A family member 9 [Batrachochytrium dendrobatidis JEL423]|uniref:ABC transporter A family member 9 n=1 Tax=Batrachochytrium dendrobatidis (strain JEL423) TaxID=403673 RepID=A0A177WJ04_BATDL|nr:ABC transporter A family member 9 [Batrachochytrium dendrobatidis JEL423]